MVPIAVLAVQALALRTGTRAGHPRGTPLTGLAMQQPPHLNEASFAALCFFYTRTWTRGVMYERAYEILLSRSRDLVGLYFFRLQSLRI